MTTTVLSEGSAATVVEDARPGRFNWSAVIAGGAVAAATSFFLITLGAGFGLVLSSPASAGTFLTLGAIWVLAVQAFGFAAGGHVTGRLIGPAVETKKEEEFRAGLHGLVSWAVTVVIGGILLALAVAGGSAMHRNTARSESSIAAYWADTLLYPNAPHAFARGEDLAHDKEEAARVLVADLHPGNTDHGDNMANLTRLTAMDAGLSMADANARVRSVEDRMKKELDTARKAAGYAGLWTAFALLFGAILAVAAAISARWEDDKLHFSWARRY